MYNKWVRRNICKLWNWWYSSFGRCVSGQICKKIIRTKNPRHFSLAFFISIRAIVISSVFTCLWHAVSKQVDVFLRQQRQQEQRAQRFMSRGDVQPGQQDLCCQLVNYSPVVSPFPSTYAFTAVGIPPCSNTVLAGQCIHCSTCKWDASRFGGAVLPFLPFMLDNQW